MYYRWIFIMLIGLLFTACANQKQDVFHTAEEAFEFPPPTLPPDKPPKPTETPWHLTDHMPEGYVQSRLTGLPIPAEYDGLRPIAVVINNMYRALPQSGISQAEIIYEVLAEGDITRLVAIFQAHELEKIGPVRSARDYFIDFALDYDAVFVHHGGSPNAYSRLRQLGIDRMDGMNLEGNCFWRDRTFPEWYAFNEGTRSLEHSSYTASAPLRAVLADREARTQIAPGFDFGFAFSVGEGPAYRRVDEALRVTVPFSRNYTRTFVYDPETALYTVYNREGIHVDAENGEPVLVRNIIIQSVRTYVIAGDTEGRRDVQTIGEGQGLLVKDGYYERVRWEKDDHFDPIRWYYLDGAGIELSPGRTWVCVFQENGTVIFGEEADE
jgi:hypothetical protein